MEKYENSRTTFNFFSELLSFDKEEFSKKVLNETFEETSNNISEAKKLKIKSLFQIIFFIFHRGQKRTPLHVMTGMNVHATCKSSSVIKGLNKTGMSISYDEILRCRTRLASYVVNSGENNVPIPRDFDKSKFTKGAFDNFDHEEATQSELNSTHDTVAVFFQEPSNLIVEKPRISNTNVSRKATSFHEELKCQKLLTCLKSKTPVIFSDNYFINLTTPLVVSENYSSSSINDFAWVVCRMSSSNFPNLTKFETEMQHTPSWSAFNSILLPDQRKPEKIKFLPILPHPVTEYSTVYTAKSNFNDVLSQLDQKDFHLFCDEGVYRIARHIKSYRKDEFKNIVLMLGSSHMAKVTLACIGKYLRGNGVEHIFIETETFGVNVTEQVLNGSNYSRSMKGFSILAEALQRLQLNEFITKTNLDIYENELVTLIVT